MADSKYLTMNQRHKIVPFVCYLSKTSDADIILYLKKCNNKSKFIGKAVRDKIRKEKTVGTANWIRFQKDKNHYYYVCDHCKHVSKYLKTPYCPYCGYVMNNNGR